jgi:hypothetical protein
MFDIPDTIRHIVGYSKIPDRHGARLAEIDYEFVKPVPLSFFQDLFGIPRDYPDEGVRYMIDCFKIDQEKADALQPFLKEKLDLNKYNFQLECSDKDSYKKWKEVFGKEEKKVEFEELIYFAEAHPNEPDENGEMWSKRYELQKPITLKEINKIFNVDPSDKEIFRGDEIDAAQAEKLQPYFKERLDVDNFLIYFTTRLKPKEVGKGD